MNSQAKMLEMQMHIRQNATELNDYLHDLDMWENDIKKQDETFSRMKPNQENKLITPVRGKLMTNGNKAEKVQQEKPKRIKSYDFKSWDKLDVDKMIDDIDAQEEEEEIKEQEKTVLELKKLSILEKDKGNNHFKAGRYEKSIDCYTKGMELDPSNPILPANRAMSYLKLKRFVESEADCTLSLSLDPTYVKAYLRRGSARNALGKVESAVKDFNDVMKLEPDNKQAKQELEIIKKKTSPVSEKPVTANKSIKSAPMKSCIVKPINKPKHLRSKKPLRRINIEEVGICDPKTVIEENEREQFSKKVKLEEVDQDLNCETNPNSFPSNQSTTHTSTSPNENNPPPPSSTPTNENNLPPLPSTPTTSFQFQADVRRLKSHPHILFDYLLQLNVNEIPALLKDQLDTDLLLDIVNCFLQCFIGNRNFVIQFLQNLTKVRRFDMAVLFMSEANRNTVCCLRDKLVEVDVKDEELMRKLFLNFGLK